MLIGFDASRAFVDEATGTENYSLNLLRVLARVDRKNRYRVYIRSSGNQVFRLSGSRRSSRQLFEPEPQSRRPDNPMSWLPSNFEVVKIRPNRLWTQVGLAWETWKNPVDVLFVPAHTLPILRRRRIVISNFKFQISNFPKTVVTIHDLGVEYLPNYHKFPQRYYLDFASRYAAKHADGIIAVSAATKADLIKRYNLKAKKIFVVHEGVDRGFFKPSSKLNPSTSLRTRGQSARSKYKINGSYILFVGTVQPRKNLQMLIEEFAKVVRLSGDQVIRKNKMPDDPMSRLPDNLQLVIAGKLGWDFDKILALPKKLGIFDRVKFLGHVPNSDLPALYSGAAVFAFPSLFEGFGLPILEALSCGCRVIASDIPPHREIFKKLFPNISSNPDFSHLTPMVLVKPNDIDVWARVLYQSITQYEERVDFNNKISNLEAEFNWAEAGEKTLEVFNKILE